MFTNLNILLRFYTAFIYAIKEFLFDKPHKETPLLYYVQTPQNMKMINALSIKDFTPSQKAPGPYSQFILALISTKQIHKYTHQEVITTKDDIPLILDWKMHLDRSRPIIVICHGIAGDSSCSFPIRFSDLAHESGYNSVIYNRRGHNHAPIVSHKSKGYPIHCDTSDLHHVAMHIKQKYPNNKLFIAATSAGSNVVTKYLAQFYATQPFTAAYISACAFDLAYLVNSYKQNNRIADALLCKCLLDMMNQRMPFLKSLAMKKNVNLDFKAIQRATSVHDLEKALTLPFYSRQYSENIDDYYVQNSSHKYLQLIQIPCLCLNAIDDILIPEVLTQHPINAALINPHLITLITKQGGHAGWISDDNASWDIPIAIKFFNHVTS